MDKSKKVGHSQEKYARIAAGIDEISPDLDKLHVYTRTKLALAGQLRIVRESLTTLGREKAERQCGDLMVKLAEDRFTLAVLGQFKRGKSSLMNAIIGSELLPIGVLPLTSAITVLRYGPKERLIINRENSILDDELPVSSLPEYVTETGNPGNIRKVKTACVEVPVSFLRNGIEFVDTPGVGSSIIANTATTYDFLPECDAVLFVTSIDTPMTSTELAFLREIRKYVNKIFFVINKIDLVVDEERDKVLNFVADTIRAQTGSETVKVFPLSALMGLTARMTGDAVLYEQSGLKALEDTLASFLSGEKSSVFLAAVDHKALLILHNEASQDAFGEVAIEARARVKQEEKIVTIHRDPHSAAVALILAWSKLKLLYEEITDSRIPEMEEIEIQSPVITMEKSQSKQVLSVGDIAVDFLSRGCPVCKHLIDYASDFFGNWQYKISTDEYAQKEFATELGFCPLHTWQLLAMCSPHGSSVGFATLTEQISRHLREVDATSIRGKTVQQMVRDSHNCRVCEMLHLSEMEYIKQLSIMISETAGRGQYRRSQGVCLRHLGMLIDTVSSAESRKFLLSHAALQFEYEAQDMRSFAMKHEALRRALQNSNEQDAYRRAIIHIVGDRGVYTPWPEDREI
jgi:predicted GTPase